MAAGYTWILDKLANGKTIFLRMTNRLVGKLPHEDRKIRNNELKEIRHWKDVSRRLRYEIR